jgi:pyruvate dehydrogenase E1 component alpha subunit
VFLVENNQWAISCPSKDQSGSKNFATKAIAYGMEGLLIDGNDVLAVYEASKHAADKARNGGGPTLIENVTYRLFSHSSSDDATKYSDQKEYDAALKREPLIRYRKYLEREKVWTKSWEEDMAESFKKEVSVAIKAAEEAPRPDPATIFERVYAAGNPLLQEQWRQLQEELEERESWDDEGAFPL